ncbi:unnamed protein product, partial [Pylaiella littoralis]
MMTWGSGSGSSSSARVRRQGRGSPTSQSARERILVFIGNQTRRRGSDSFQEASSPDKEGEGGE